MPLPPLNASSNPKGERGPPEAALKRVLQNLICNFQTNGVCPKVQMCTVGSRLVKAGSFVVKITESRDVQYVEESKRRRRRW